MLAHALAVATLQIMDRHHERSEAPKAKGHAFQLIAKEARAAPDVVTVGLGV